MFNLINERWIPVRRENSAEIEYIAPWQITEGIESQNPIYEIASPRPDFDGALLQFLIGLVQTTIPPANDSEYIAMLESPPAPGMLKAAFEKVAQVFNLDGGTGRFMQDYKLTIDYFEKKGKKSELIAGLLMETRRPGKDLFVKNGSVKHICRGCLAAVLYTLQVNSPQGGAGHRTSLRGGGPLTTLIVGKNLWDTVCLNLLTSDVFLSGVYGNPEKVADEDRFPWMAPTKESKSSKMIALNEANPVKVFWAMPRRFVIDYSESGACTCDICGVENTQCVSRYFTETYGENYDSSVWRHPLSPYYKDKKGWLPVHTKSVGRSSVSYNGVPVYVLGENDMGRRADVISEFIKRQDSLLLIDPFFYLHPHIWCFGYSMNIAAAECWYEGRMPLIVVDESIREEYETTVIALVKLAEYAANKVRYRIKRAGISNTAVDARFWLETDTAFYNTIHELQVILMQGENEIKIKLEWLKYLSKVSLVLFDEYSQFNLVGNVAYLKHVQDIAESRKQLRIELSTNENTIGGKEVLKILDLTPEEVKNFMEVGQVD